MMVFTIPEALPIPIPGLSTAVAIATAVLHRTIAYNCDPNLEEKISRITRLCLLSVSPPWRRALLIQTKL